MPTVGAHQFPGRAVTDAHNILDAILDLVRDNRTFGGIIKPGIPARLASSRVILPDKVQAAGEGRTCEIRFTLEWTHRR